MALHIVRSAEEPEVVGQKKNSRTLTSTHRCNRDTDLGLRALKTMFTAGNEERRGTEAGRIPVPWGEHFRWRGLGRGNVLSTLSTTAGAAAAAVALLDGGSTV